MCVFWTSKIIIVLVVWLLNWEKSPCEESNGKCNWHLSWETKPFLLLMFWSISKLPCVAFYLSKICNWYRNSTFLISFFANNLFLSGSCLNSSAMLATKLSSASSTFFLWSLDSILSFHIFSVFAVPSYFLSLQPVFSWQFAASCLSVHLPFLAFQMLCLS